MPPDLLGASISVIPKPGKDSLLCTDYRSISLLNYDLKLFTKILAERMGSILQRIIPIDQVSFIRNREVRDNTIRTINVIVRAKHLNTPFILLSTDAVISFVSVIGSGWRQRRPHSQSHIFYSVSAIIIIIIYFIL